MQVHSKCDLKIQYKNKMLYHIVTQKFIFLHLHFLNLIADCQVSFKKNHCKLTINVKHIPSLSPITQGKHLKTALKPTHLIRQFVKLIDSKSKA